MNFRNDPFFEEVAPPPVSLFPDMGLVGSSGTRRHHHHHHHDRSLALSPFGGMGMGPMMPFGPSPFSMMSGMMQNMDNMMRNMQSQAAAGGHSYSSSTTVMHYSSDGRGGQPHTYQATSSTRQGPGGVKETKKAVKDSQSGVQKMAVGHHIGDRAHVIERQVNAKTGEKAQNQEFINLDESEADEFGVEWKGKTHTLNHSSSLLHPSLGHSHRNHLAESRGLPSTSRPRSPVEGEGEARGRRRSRPVSLSAEDEETGLCHSTTTSTKKSPKMSRTKSPPHGHKPKPAHQNPHSHSSQLQTDLPPFRSEAPPTSSTETSRGRKKKGGKRTTFAADV